MIEGPFSRRGDEQRRSRGCSRLADELTDLLTTPSFAQRSEGGDVGMSSEREKALKDCTAEPGKLRQHTWGDHQIQKYRSCMMQYSQRE